MKQIGVAFLIVLMSSYVRGQEKATVEKYHFVCIQSADTYHDNSTCTSLQMCSGKSRRTKNIKNLKACRKCVVRRPMAQIVKAEFLDIKRVLGVKDKKQIADSLGTREATIRRAGGVTIRISGPPESKTVNMIEFYLDKPMLFQEDSLFSDKFYDRLALKFNGCRADTIRNTIPHPVTGKIKKDVSIEYRGCAIVEPRDAYEDVRKYYYELIFLSRERDLSVELEKIQLILRVDRP